MSWQDFGDIRHERRKKEKGKDWSSASDKALIAKTDPDYKSVVKEARKAEKKRRESVKKRREY